MTDGFESLELTLGPVAQIRFTRPDLSNRFDAVLHREFPAALAHLGDGDDLAALVISGRGKHFSAGGDLPMMLQANTSATLREQLMREGRAIVDRLISMSCPVIAAVQGGAIGLGATVVSCCDIVVASRDARIADPHVLLGLVAGDGGILGWSQSVGIARAKRYLLTGDRLDAETAHAIGLVSDLVERPEEALPAALSIAARIAALPRGGVRGTKRAFSRLTRDLYASAFELSLAYEIQTMASDEVRDAVSSALQPRGVAP